MSLGSVFCPKAAIVNSSLEALPVSDGGTRLIILLPRDPHGLEGGERGQDGATNPDGVLPLGRSYHPDLQGVRGKGSDLFLHSSSNSREHGGTTRQDGVGIEILL